MRKHEKNYIDKGIYSHPQLGGYLTLKQFILIEQDKKRCLLLRFANESDLEINAARFILKQLNSDGEEIGRVDISYKDISIASGAMYSSEQGIVVKKECVDFTVQMVSVVSGDYRYVFENGTVTAHYDRRGYGERVRKDRKRGSAEISVRSKYKGGGRFYGFIAFVALVLAVISLLLVIYNTDSSEDEMPDDSVPMYETRK